MIIIAPIIRNIPVREGRLRASLKKIKPMMVATIGSMEAIIEALLASTSLRPSV